MTGSTETLQLVETSPNAGAILPQQTGALAPTSPAGLMLELMGRGASLADIREMMDIQATYEKREAEKAYNAAFSAFKAEAVRIIKNRDVKDGPLKGKQYAELHSVVDALTPALSRNGLGASWRLTKDDRDWIEVTCTLKHVAGHSESVSMGGPPDAGGAKNAIQARASTVSYLERYTLKAICGVAEGGQDDDGNGGAGNPPAPPPPSAAPAFYPQDRFETNLPAWRKAIAEGIKSADEIIAFIESKAPLTNAQKQSIRATT